MDVFKLKRFTDEGVINDQLRAEQLVSPLAIDEEKRIFMCDDSTLAFAFECQPLCGGGEKELEKLNQLLSQNFPPNTTISFLLFRSPDIEEHVTAAERLRFHFSHPVLTPVFKEREAFLKSYTEKDMVARSTSGATFNIGRVVDVKLIVSVKIPFTGGGGIGGIGGGSTAVIPSQDAQEAVLDWATKIYSALKVIGFAPVQMDGHRYVRFMNVFLNWGSSGSSGSSASEGLSSSPPSPSVPVVPTWRQRVEGLWERDKPIPAQVFDPETSVWMANKNFFMLGDGVYVKTMSAKKFPESTYFGNAIQYAGDLSGLNGGIHANYAVCCNVIFPDPLKMKDSLSKKRTWANNQAFGPLMKFDPMLGEIKKSFDTIYESMMNGGRPLKTSFHVILFGRSEKEITSLSSQAASFWSDQHFTLKEDTFVMLPIFKNCLPMCCDRKAITELWRYKTMTSAEVPAVLPIFGESKGTGTPHLQLLSRNGQLMNISLHDSSTNQNAVVAAESGSGKSFLLNELVLDYMSEGARVWIIDAGKSYKKLCEALGGDFVEFSERSRISLNPFATVVDWNSEEDAVVNLLSTMASMEGKLDDYQIAALKGHMHRLWDEDSRSRMETARERIAEIDAHFDAEIANVMERVRRGEGGEGGERGKGGDTDAVAILEEKREVARFEALPPPGLSIDAVAEACLADPDKRVNDVGVQLGSFTSKSSYGKFFAGRNNASFRNDLTVLELDELQGRKHLRQVVLLQLISQIQREIFLGERNRKKIVIIDEAWDLLKEGEVASFMESAYRKFRKYSASAIIATQSAGDLIGSSAGVAIQNNSANTFYLGQKATTLEQLRKANTLVMEDWAFNLLKSVRTEAGVYSEIFFQQGPIQCVGRLVVSEYQKLLYSTNPADVNAIRNYQARGCTVDEAIRAVLRERKERRG